MKVGVGLPNGGLDPSVDDLVRLAVEVEQMGFDSVWTLDRWLRPHAKVTMPGVPVPVEMPADSYRVVFDPLDLLSFIAARTSRVRLGTSAINVLYQPPVLLARRFATLDHLSGGRVLAGVTSGWMLEEFDAAGVSAGLMGDGFDEHLEVMRRVWGPDPVEHRGEHYRIAESDIGPKPVGGSIPLLVGYNTTAGIRRAARIGDGLHPYRMDLDQLRRDLDVFREAADEAGRDHQALPVVLRVSATIDDSGEDSTLFAGPVRTWIDDIARVAAVGVDHVVIQTDGSIETQLERFDDLRSRGEPVFRQQ